MDGKQMADKQISLGLKTALEFGPLMVFLAAIFLFKGHEVTIHGTQYGATILATILFIPLLVLATFALWRMTGRLSPTQIITLVLVLVMGGLTIWLNDDRFIKMKPTILYTAFAATLGFGLLRKQSYLAYVMDGALPLKPEGWMILTRRIMLLFLGMAVANEIVWRHTSDQVWALYKFPGMPLVMFAFFITQAGLMKRFSLEDDAAG